MAMSLPYARRGFAMGWALGLAGVSVRARWEFFVCSGLVVVLVVLQGSCSLAII